MFHTGFLRLHIQSCLRYAPYSRAASANSKIRVFTQLDPQRTLQGACTVAGRR
jgi:hypothetical protein